VRILDDREVPNMQHGRDRSLVLAATLALLMGGAIFMQDAHAAQPDRMDRSDQPELQTITMGGGCFWCLEAVFEELAGVTRVESGYAGGHIPHPTYKQVCSGNTGHAEVVQVTFDPHKVSLEEILTVFFGTHDPTTLNRQGADSGTQYRSIILYQDAAQKQAAERLIHEMEAEKVFKNPIVTEVEPLEAFYPAEDYHQEYYRENPEQAYCQYVIAPKLEKFRKRFHDMLKH
jgi:peptide-methionine (S)-S-oxide reductase